MNTDIPLIFHAMATLCQDGNGWIIHPIITQGPDAFTDKYDMTVPTLKEVEPGINTLLKRHFDVAEDAQITIAMTRQIENEGQVTCKDFRVWVRPAPRKPVCYQCNQPVNYLFLDGRCGKCTRLTPEEVMGVKYESGI